MEFPDVMPVERIDARHADYAALATPWMHLALLREGGVSIKRAAAEFVQRRPQELRDVYEARLRQFRYTNYLGAGIAWYAAALFGREPVIQVEDDTDEEFMAAFLENCDRRGTRFVDLFKMAVEHWLTFGSAWLLLDLPIVPDVEPLTRLEQESAGALDAYLTLFDPRSVINWQVNSSGGIEWVTLKTETDVNRFGQKPEKVTQWRVFDSRNVAVYEASPGRDTARLIRKSPHALSSAGRLPLRRLSVPPALWIANRVYLQLLDHVNMDNVLAWGLFMANLPVPIIKGEFRSQPQVSEVEFIHLEENGAFEWAEPSGRSFDHAAARLANLREEIFRGMHLQAQGRSTEATPAAQSGYSKELDMAPARDILADLGRFVKQNMRITLSDVMEVRDNAGRVVVTGMEFDEPAVEELEFYQAVADRVTESPTLRKELHKRFARRALRGSHEDTLRAVEKEIDASPDDLEEARRNRETEALRDRFLAAIPSGR